MKECTTCNISKPLSEFNKAKTSKDGLQYKCKDCYKQYSQDNKEFIGEYRKQHSQDNKESIGEYQKQYRQDNKEYKRAAIKELHMSEGYGVYTLTHLPTQCYYVGEGQIHGRRNNHFSTLKNGTNECALLQEHYNKHPNKDDWEFEAIRKWDEINKSEGKKIENKLIKWGLENMPKKLLNIKE